MVQATSSILVIRSTIHFGCVLALRGRAWMVLAARDVRGRRPEAPCSETPRPTGRSRLGTAEVNSFSLSRSSNGQDAGLSIRQCGFDSRTRYQQTEAIVELTLRWRKSAATIGRHRNPSPEHPCFVNSVVRVPACLAGSRGFESRTGRQLVAAVAQWVERLVEGQGVGGSRPSRGTKSASLAQWDQSAGLRSRRLHVRVMHEAPDKSGLAQSAEQRPPKPKVRGSIPWPGASVIST